MVDRERAGRGEAHGLGGGGAARVPLRSGGRPREAIRGELPRARGCGAARGRATAGALVPRGTAALAAHGPVRSTGARALLRREPLRDPGVRTHGQHARGERGGHGHRRRAHGMVAAVAGDPAGVRGVALRAGGDGGGASALRSAAHHARRDGGAAELGAQHPWHVVARGGRGEGERGAELRARGGRGVARSARGGGVSRGRGEVRGAADDGVGRRGVRRALLGRLGVGAERGALPRALLHARGGVRADGARRGRAELAGRVLGHAARRGDGSRAGGAQHLRARAAGGGGRGT